MKFLSKKIYILLFAFSLLFSIKLYSSSLDYFFFQDDFFEINISKVRDATSYLDFYKFRNDIIAYRPISLQNYFLISKFLFDLNPVGYRFITFMFFLSSAYLITKVVYKLTQNSKIAFLTASFWLISAIHFMSLTWIAAAYNIIGTFFWLLTTLFFLLYLEKKKFSYYIFSIITFFLTIGSFEFSITWPIIFSLYYFFLLKNSLAKSLKVFYPFLILSLVYLLLRTFLIKVPQIPEYKVAVNVGSLKALLWYFLWSFNIPEEFKKQIIKYLILFKERFLIDYYLLVIVSSISFLWILTIGALILLYRNLKNQNSTDFRFLIFCLFWFIIGISPVLLLPNHTFTMYLTLPSIGIYLILSYILVKNSQPIATGMVILLFLISSVVTLNFYKTNSWMIEAQKFSGRFSTNIKLEYPTLPKNSVVLYPLVEQESRQALLYSNALQALYDDSTLTIYYNKLDLIKGIQKNNQRPIYIYFH